MKAINKIDENFPMIPLYEIRYIISYKEWEETGYPKYYDDYKTAKESNQ